LAWSSLLPLAEVTERLRVTGQGYLGVRSIPLTKIIGSVDRACEFDRDFRPQRRDSEARMCALEAAFPGGDFPAISVLEVGGAYNPRRLSRRQRVLSDGRLPDSRPWKRRSLSLPDLINTCGYLRRLMR
jgi:hypothetical protein